MNIGGLFGALTPVFFVLALGYLAGSNLTTGNHNIDIGNTGQAGETGKIRIGTRGAQNTTYIAGIFGATVSGGVTVSVDNKGHLRTTTSSVAWAFFATTGSS